MGLGLRGYQPYYDGSPYKTMSDSQIKKMVQRNRYKLVCCFKCGDTRSTLLKCGNDYICRKCSNESTG